MATGKMTKGKLQRQQTSQYKRQYQNLPSEMEEDLVTWINPLSNDDVGLVDGQRSNMADRVVSKATRKYLRNSSIFFYINKSLEQLTESD